MVTYKPVGVDENSQFPARVETRIGELVRDVIAAALVAGTGITITVNDPGETITLTSPTNNEEIQDLLNSTIVAGPNMTKTYDDTAGTLTLSSTASGGGGAALGTWVDNYIQAGDTHDGQAINRALAAIPSGGAILFTPGKLYASNSTVSLPSKSAYGFGAKINVTGTTAFSLSGTGSEVHDLNATTTSTLCVNVAAGAQHAKWHGGSLYGPTQCFTVNAAGIDHVVLANARISSGGYGVLTNVNATDLRDLRVIGNTFDDITSDAIELNHPGSAGTGTKGFLVANNYIRCALGSGTVSGFGVGVAHATNGTINANVIEDCRNEALHIEDSAGHVVMTNNVLRNNRRGLWAINCAKLIISNNVIEGGERAIYVTYDTTPRFVQNVSIMGNVCSGQSVSGINHFSNQPLFSTIVGNVVSDSAGEGIDVSDTSDWIITNNILRNNAGTDIAAVADAATRRIIANNITV